MYPKSLLNEMLRSAPGLLPWMMPVACMMVENAPATAKLRPLSVIAAEIRKDWKKPYFGAVPYLQAMADLDSIDDKYGEDSAKSIVLYFLANAQSWRGETAKRVKAELKKLAGIK